MQVHTACGRLFLANQARGHPGSNIGEEVVHYVTEETNSEIDVEKKALLKTCGKEKNERHLPETRNKFTGQTAKMLSGAGIIKDGPICWIFCTP